MRIPFKRLLPAAFTPFLANPGDAGYDLFNMEEQDYWLRPGERKLFRTGLAMAIPQGFYGRIADRSGLALKQGIHVLGGVVDSAYRGEIGVILLNTSDCDDANTVRINREMKIAQLIIERCERTDFEEVQELPASERGMGGFGSSGV